jgi:Winged helix-turn helix
VAPGLAGRRDAGAAVQRAGVAGEAEPAAVGPAGVGTGKGPLAHGFAGSQYRTPGRIKTLAGRLFHVGYTVEGVWKLLRRHGWSCQVPVRQAMERDEEAIAAWKAGVWPGIKAPCGLGAWICFEDEAGQGLRPPRGRTRAPRGARPVAVRGGGTGRVSVAGVACCRPGDRPHLCCKPRVHRRRKGEARGFTWTGYGLLRASK